MDCRANPTVSARPATSPANNNNNTRVITSKYFASPSSGVVPGTQEQGFQLFARIFTQVYLSKPILIQEVVRDSPWKLLIAVILLNKTSGQLALPIFWQIISWWPTPEKLSSADVTTLTEILSLLGLQNTRARRLIQLSKMILETPPQDCVVYKSRARENDGAPYPPTAISHLPGCGKYALDSYRIFCMGGEEWKHVMPEDKELNKYLQWKWVVEEFKEWNNNYGVVGNASRAYLEFLLLQLN